MYGRLTLSPFERLWQTVEGTAVTFCASGGRLGSLCSKSPSALDSARLPEARNMQQRLRVRIGMANRSVRAFARGNMTRTTDETCTSYPSLHYHMTSSTSYPVLRTRIHRLLAGR